MPELIPPIDLVQKNKQVEMWKWIFISITIILPISALFWAPQLTPFWLFELDDIWNLFLLFFIVALVMERAIEVILGAWRGRGKVELLARLDGREKQVLVEEDSELEVSTYIKLYRNQTRILALLLSLTFGVTASLLGLRILQPLVDPAVFNSLSTLQSRLFTTYDVFITGAMLGGGSEGIHRIVGTILDFVELRRQKQKKWLDKL